jgi:GDPmannose 4,6-dehydratase
LQSIAKDLDTASTAASKRRTADQAGPTDRKAHPPMPEPDCCRSHWQGANYRETYGLFACSGILFNHESPLRPERFVTRKIVAAAGRIARGSTEPLRLGNLDIHRDWGWAPEYVDAMWRMLQQEQTEDFVIATGHTHSLEDFVATAFGVHGLDWRDHVQQDLDLLRPADIRFNAGDATSAKTRLGWVAQHRMPDVVQFMAEAE